TTELDSLEGDQLPGEVAFKLHDTYGFPIELTPEIAAEHGVSVDREGLEAEMTAQKERARGAGKGGEAVAAADGYRALAGTGGLTDFAGYEGERGAGQVLAVVVEGERRQSLEEGQKGEVLLDSSPFHAESGGQVG